MPRNDFGKMPDQQRIQPGRLMIVLTDPLVMDDVVIQIAKQYGNIKGLHRPANNQQWVFLQYEDPDCCFDAIEKLRNYPIFRTVGPALKSDRFINENANDNNYGNSSRNNAGGKSKGNRHNNQNNQKHQNAKTNVNGNNSFNNDSNYNGGLDGSYQQSDRELSPQKQMGDFFEYQPEIPLGCWFCTKMPSFECQCGAYYCDTSCQRSDWAKHKLICMPRLVPISYSNKRMLQEANASKQNSSVSSSTFSPASQETNQQQARGTQENNSFARGGAQNSQKKNQPNAGNKNLNKTQARNGTDADLDAGKNRQKQAVIGSPEDANKMNQLGGKLQRLKLAKSASKERILHPGPFPRIGSRVKISASLSGGIVFIYHNNAETGDSSDYHKLGNRIYQASKNAQPLKEIPHVDDVIFAPFMGGFYRGKVLRIQEDQLEIQFPDFGNIAVIPWKQAKEIADEDLKWAKYLTFPVMLEGVGMFSKNQKQLLDSYEESVDFELIKASAMRDSEMQEVVLKRPRETVTLNMQLLESKETLLREKKQQEEPKERGRPEKECTEKPAKIADPSNYSPVLFDESIETKQLTLDSKQRMMIIDASEMLDTRIISVIGCEFIEPYATVLQNCLQLGQLDSNPYQPRMEGEVCLVSHESDWSRALYDISEGNFMLLDVGIIASIPMDNVRRFPPGLSKVVYNNEVIVENMPVLKTMMVDGKPDSVHGKVIEAWVSNSEDGVSVRIVP